MFVISEFGLYGGNQEIMSHAKLSKCPSKLGSTEVPYTIYQISTGPVVLEKILYNFTIYGQGGHFGAQIYLSQYMDFSL